MTSAIRNKKILITGAGGLMGRPVAEALAKDNEVWGVSLFKGAEAEVKSALEAQGIKIFSWDMSKDDLHGLPDDFTHVFHYAMLRDTSSYDDAIDVNSLAAARLMTHCRKAGAFLYVSTVRIYNLVDRKHVYKETDAIGTCDTLLGPYAVGKIAAEGVVRSLCRVYNLPTIIVRPNAMCGAYDWGGVPIMFLKEMMAGRPIAVPLEGDNWLNPIHTDDIVRFVPGFYEHAAVPAPIINLGGDESVTWLEVIKYISEITGVAAKFERSEVTRPSLLSDNSRRIAMVGQCQIGWREGVRRVIQDHLPGVLGA